MKSITPEPTDTGHEAVQRLEFDENERPYSLQFGDHFYSSTGGRDECRHVFIHGNQLPDRWREPNQFSIAELGFGTSLNFLETWSQWIGSRREGQHLNFVSFELLPMHADDIRRAISPFGELVPLCERLLAAMAAGDAGSGIDLDAQMRLTVVSGDCGQSLPLWPGKVDSWYLDGFSPAKNPQMWGKELLEQVFEHTRPGGTFATYTSAGWVRKYLQKAGFVVQRQPGFGRKKHMSAGFRSE